MDKNSDVILYRVSITLLWQGNYYISFNEYRFNDFQENDYSVFEIVHSALNDTYNMADDDIVIDSILVTYGSELLDDSMTLLFETVVGRYIRIMYNCDMSELSYVLERFSEMGALAPISEKHDLVNFDELETEL